MLFTLLAGIYITLICHAWGLLVCRFFKRSKLNSDTLPHFSLLCLFGFSVITILAGFISLFFPLGGWSVQLVFLIPAILIYIKFNSTNLLIDFKELKLLPVLLLVLITLLLLLMSSWKIVHPDTLSYHAQTIQWIEKYKSVPGLVHLHTRLGYQGLWFVSCALFSFKFLNSSALVYVNFPLLFWFILFIVSRINNSFKEKEVRLNGIIWVALLFYCLWNYTQVRLTATSASADFIGVIFTLATLYLFIENKFSVFFDENKKWLPIFLLSLTAVTIKLSTFPILLFPFAGSFYFIFNKKIKQLFFALLISLIILIPFVARNIISSGYVVFPSTVIDIAQVDWKLDPRITTEENNYIKAYARISEPDTRENIDTILKMKPADWIPVWWSHRSIADQLLLVLLLLVFPLSLYNWRKIVKSSAHLKIGILIMLSGIIFWFINAPDPRFGFGFIIGFITLIMIILQKNITIKRKYFILLIILGCLTTTLYLAYRFKKFFSAKQWIQQTGVIKTPYTTIECKGLPMNIPAAGNELGITPIPCTDRVCEDLEPRSNKITDGFKTK